MRETQKATAGRIRAIEVILLELHEVTPSLIEAAKARVKDRKRMREPDLDVEKALDELTYQAVKKQDRG